MGTYKIKFNMDPHEKLDKLKKAASRIGIRFDGDIDSGTFSGSGLKGKYRREGSHVVVTITSTPFFVSEEKVVRELRKFLK